VTHDHDVNLPALPTAEGSICPALLPDGSVCGQEMAFAHNVREFYPVRSWGQGSILLGSCKDIDTPDDPEPHLFCMDGHDWAVPEWLEFE